MLCSNESLNAHVHLAIGKYMMAESVIGCSDLLVQGLEIAIDS